mgnify:CR=1 FL=1
MGNKIPKGYISKFEHSNDEFKKTIYKYYPSVENGFINEMMVYKGGSIKYQKSYEPLNCNKYLTIFIKERDNIKYSYYNDCKENNFLYKSVSHKIKTDHRYNLYKQESNTDIKLTWKIKLDKENTIKKNKMSYYKVIGQWIIPQGYFTIKKDIGITQMVERDIIQMLEEIPLKIPP